MADNNEEKINNEEVVDNSSSGDGGGKEPPKEGGVVDGDGKEEPPKDGEVIPGDENEAVKEGMHENIVTEITKTRFGTVAPLAITDEMRVSYLDYAMSVIVMRALPDVRDGLKPVHRRILYAMWSIGLRSSAKFRKSATIVGEVLGKYHPHGDASVYDSMVRMAQDFSMRYMLVKGQGNFGSMDGDRAAAYRYTEAKLSQISEELLFDIEKETVNFAPNFDGSHNEPKVLPARLPNLLLNGTMGIAVGMSTNIPPHNLSELVAAITHLIENPDTDIEKLAEFVTGPDFPTGGIIYNKKDILQTYLTGRGGIVMRAKTDIQERKNGMFQIVITELPYQVNKANLVEKIADLVRNKKIDGIKDLRDESDKEGVRVVVDLKKDTYPKKILNSLYKQTQLQETFHVNMLALVDGIQPKVLNLKVILEEYIKHREEVIKRRTEYDLRRAKARAHILEGLMIALQNIDAVIKLIKESKDKDEAKNGLMKKFKLTEIQSIAILEMRLQNLANLERLRIENELKEKKALIEELESILASRIRVLDIIKAEIKELNEKFGDERKTQVMTRGIKDFAIEDLVANEETMVVMTKDGYIKRFPTDTFKVQARGGKGVVGLSTKTEDIVEFMFTTMAHTDILFFTTRGRVFQLKAYEIPQTSRTAKGQAIVNFLQLPGSEKVTSILPLDKISNKQFIFFATEKGLVKKVRLAEFASVRRTGLIVVKIRDEDKLIWTKPSAGEDDVILITKKGQSIRFSEEDVRAMGRTAAGVTGIRLKNDDLVVGMGVINTDPGKIKSYELLSITERGLGKRTSLNDYKKQGRGGSGIKTAKVTSKTGDLLNAFVVNNEKMKEKDLIMISTGGQVIRLPYKAVPKSGRDTQGVKLMRFKNGDDTVASMTWT